MINFNNIEAFSNWYKELHKIDYMRFYSIVARLMSRSIAQNFRELKIRDPETKEVTGTISEGRGDWAPLQPSTISARLANSKWPGKIGSVTGQLKSSITYDINPASGILIGTNKEYARAFQFGMKHTIPVTPKMRRFFWFMFYKTKDIMWRRMALTKKTEFRITSPPRPFLAFQKEDIDNITKELWKMIEQKFRQA